MLSSYSPLLTRPGPRLKVLGLPLHCASEQEIESFLEQGCLEARYADRSAVTGDAGSYGDINLAKMCLSVLFASQKEDTSIVYSPNYHKSLVKRQSSMFMGKESWERAD